MSLSALRSTNFWAIMGKVIHIIWPREAGNDYKEYCFKSGISTVRMTAFEFLCAVSQYMWSKGFDWDERGFYIKREAYSEKPLDS